MNDPTPQDSSPTFGVAADGSSSIPQPPPRVLALILTWNNRTDTERCVESVLALEYPNFDVLVVDNASTDGTTPALRAAYGDRIQVLENDRNLLFAGGMNVGLRRALEDDYDFVLLLNNDVVLDPAMLHELMVVAAHDTRIAAVGPKIYYSQRPNVLWFAGGELSLWRGWSRHRGLREEDRGQHDVAGDVDYLTGCAMLMRRQALQSVGLLDTGYAMYAEDADWCFRARSAGLRLVYAPRARMWHHVSASAGARSGFKMRRRLQSQLRFLRRHARWYHAVPILFWTKVEALRVAWALLRRRI